MKIAESAILIFTAACSFVAEARLGGTSADPEQFDESHRSLQGTQTTIYSDNFDGSSLFGNWNSGGQNSQVVTHFWLGGGTRKVELKKNGSISTSFSKAGYDGYKIKFDMYANGNLANGEGLILEHSANGLTWFTAENWLEGSALNGERYYTNKKFTLNYFDSLPLSVGGTFHLFEAERRYKIG